MPQRPPAQDSYTPLRLLADRNRDGAPEQQAHDRLIQVLGSGEPHRLRSGVEIVREFFKADSAGLHIVPSASPQNAPSVDLVCGVLESQQEYHERIGSGLAKLCFAVRVPTVLREQEIELTYLRHLRPRIVHILMAPIYDDQRKPLGAIWLAQVSSSLTYSRDDTLTLLRLTHELALALQVRARER
jgi:hypothetical protein